MRPSGLLGPDTSALFRVGTAAAVGMAAAVLVGVTIGGPYAPAGGWIVAATIYLSWTWLLIAGMDDGATRYHACSPQESDGTRRMLHTLVVLASLGSLAGVGYLLAAESSPAGNLVATVVGILSVAASWFAVHTVYTLRYARLYYLGAPDDIEFHNNDRKAPTYTDFAYVAFTIGMTYQVSDTDLRSRQIRATALGQAMISFSLGAVIVAITINLVAGLANYSG
jgi:uncharacterized membrane protein